MFKKILDLLSDAATYGLSNVLAQLIGFFLLPLYTRYLTPQDYGITAMLGILGMLFGPLANLGMTSAIFRRFNLVKDGEERYAVLSTGLISVITFSGILALVAGLLSRPLGGLLVDSSEYGDLVLLTLLTAMLNTISEVPRVALRADRRVKTVALLNLISVFTAIITTIWFVVFERRGVVGVLLGNLTAAILETTLQFTVAWKSFRLAFDRQIWRSMLSYGLPFLPHRMLSLGIVQFGQYMVGSLIGLDQAGLYSIAVRVSMPVTFVVNAIQQAWVPYKFQVHARDENPAKFFSSVTTYYVAMIAYLWVGVSLWGPEVVRLMTTAGFHAAVGLVPVVSLIPLTQGIYFMLGTGIELSDDTRPMPIVSLGGLVVVVITGFLAMPYLGAAGAALATSIGWLTMTSIIYKFSQTRFRIHYDWRSIVFFGVAAIVAVVLGFSTQKLDTNLRILTAIVLSLAYPLVVFLVLYRSTNERERIKIIGLKLRQFLL